jgi:hypothetical protein|tara:strand:- start:244 stop:378 length:135 start_codon:yes stop_codon:yes gene_type:complete
MFEAGDKRAGFYNPIINGKEGDTDKEKSEQDAGRVSYQFEESLH